MTARESFLAAICATPDDDTVRLVYADWLDECGGAKNAARAELIRVQCELAKGPCFYTVTVPKLTNIRLGEPHPVAVKLCGACDRCRGGFAELRARETALLKKWAGAFLPKSLRPGYPGVCVEGATVWVDPLGGYVVFRRGFIARAGREIDARGVDEAVDPATMSFPPRWEAQAQRFGQALRAVFDQNPLEDFVVGIEGAAGSLCAEITPGTGLPQPWQVMWDVNSYSMLPNDWIEPPLTVYGRAEFGRLIGAWLVRAVREPARAVAASELEQMGPQEYQDPDEPVDPLQDDGDAGYGHTYW